MIDFPYSLEKNQNLGFISADWNNLCFYFILKINQCHFNPEIKYGQLLNGKRKMLVTVEHTVEEIHVLYFISITKPIIIRLLAVSDRKH